MTAICRPCNKRGLTVSQHTALHRAEQAWGAVAGLGLALILLAGAFVAMGGVR